MNALHARPTLHARKNHLQPHLTAPDCTTPQSVDFRPSSPAIRQAAVGDFPVMLAIFRKVLVTGDSYVLAADTTDGDAFEYWFARGIPSYVAVDEGRIVGMYRFIPNQRDRGSHVANASFMVDPEARSRGIGWALGMHCLAEAKQAGFLAMQFNMVVSTNTRAVALWRKLGFLIVGRLPGAYRHEDLGLVDAYVMHRFL
ncbi:MAG: GNAT family N-acetyltransferase [Gemmataceae bacterium]|nr:GNAT family N-acetyltransferase [Gemmataceae bacterium]